MSELTVHEGYGNDCPFPFFDEPSQSNEGYYKIYHDGGNYVATRVFRYMQKKRYEEFRFYEDTGDMDILFNGLYYQAMKDGLKDTKMDTALTDYIRAGMLKLFSDYDDLDGYIEKKIKSKRHNLYARKKRFRRKAFMNRWNYYVTFTYDDKKHTPESFERKLRKCFSNLATRRGWRIAGKFEEAPETGRLHFHGLLYVPDGEMIGRITEKQDYSTAQKTMQTRHENSFFQESFGRNDFTGLGAMELKYGRIFEYIIKYIGKDDGKMFYSRGIPTEVLMKLTDENIITAFTDYVEKFVLFDNVIDFERDILHYNRRKQMSIIDILCNPPRIAA